MGIPHTTKKTLVFPEEERYEDEGIRKAVLLLHYCQALIKYDNPRQRKDLLPSLRVFAKHFEEEMKVLNDPSLQQELDILNRVVNSLTPKEERNKEAAAAEQKPDDDKKE